MRAPIVVLPLALFSLAVPQLAVAQLTPYLSITSSTGPLTAIHLGDEASVQVAHLTDGASHEFYPPSTIPGDSGTFLVVDDTLFAPNFAQHDGSATGSIGTYTAFTPVSQAVSMGVGTPQSPFRIETVVDAGTTGVRVTHVDRYVVGEESYRTDITLVNTGRSPAAWSSTAPPTASWAAPTAASA